SWTGGFGGWPATDRGRVHSMNTGPALLALARARDLGHAVDPSALVAGRRVLLAMRDGPGTDTYTYPDPISFRQADQPTGRGAAPGWGGRGRTRWNPRSPVSGGCVAPSASR